MLQNIYFVLVCYFLIGATDTTPLAGNASYYHNRFHGRETSNGEFYNKDDFTAAHRTLPFNSIVLVTNKKNNKSVVVRINDRGPFRKSRVIDLSFCSAKKIAMVPFGVVPVRITPLTILDQLPMNDSLFHEGDVWDCYGNKKEIEGDHILIWSTDSWKHAFYMASALSVEYNRMPVCVRVSGNISRRHYSLIVCDEPGDEQKKLIRKLHDSGFLNCQILAGK